jgi:hypothetical protein
MKSEKKKADELEDELQKEEKVSEGIRDSLKGMGSFRFHIDYALIRFKTRRRYFMTRSNRSRRNFSLGKRRSTRSRPRLTSKPVSVTC